MTTDHRSPQKKIAMWSGPRNLSTAMMYSFASRDDSFVVDEPFYAAYLKKTGIIHPMNKEVLEAGETNVESVIDFCTGETPNKKPIFYQKHMTKHMIPSFSRHWITELCNVFLIREPAKVIASYHAKSDDPELSDIGVKEQLEIFDKVCQHLGKPAIVIDSADILAEPKLMLEALCAAIGIEFKSSMLSWKTGPRIYDGVWAPHWYQSVWRSSGFAKPDNSIPVVPEHLEKLLDEANGYFNQIKQYALKV